MAGRGATKFRGGNDFPNTLCVRPGTGLNGAKHGHTPVARPCPALGVKVTTQSEAHSESAASRAGVGPDDSLLLHTLLDGMDAALCAFDAEGAVTHWNREAERILGWSAQEAVGRPGLVGWALRGEDAADVQGRLLAAMRAPGRQVHEFPLVAKGGSRVLVRAQTGPVRDVDGRPVGVYCAFGEAHAQGVLERSVALSQALFDDAAWGVLLVDADLRPTAANAHAARVVGVGRHTLLGRPLGELVGQGLEELESALQHVLVEGSTSATVELWLSLPGHRGGRGPADRDGGAHPGEPGADGARRCLRSGFLRLGSPLAQQPTPLGVAWLFQDVTRAKLAEQDTARLRFRDSQLHRAARAAAECVDPREAAVVHLDFALAGFADHALLDLAVTPAADGEPSPVRLVRAAATPASVGPCPPADLDPAGAVPVPYRPGHPALLAWERRGAVRVSAGGAVTPDWAAARKWPDGVVHALCVVLRSRGRSLGVVTFLRGPGRRAFDREDAAYAEDVAVRVAAAVDLARVTAG